MNAKTVLSTLIFFSVIASAADIKTNEQLAKEGAASVYGSNLRMNGVQKSQCKNNNFNQGEQEACYRGYDKADKTLNRPASR